MKKSTIHVGINVPHMDPVGFNTGCLWIAEASFMLPEG